MAETTTEAVQHPLYAEARGEYSWCLYCEKVHRTETWARNDHKCPACGASALDQWRWEQIRAANPGYPEHPDEGAHYAQYPTVAS